MHTQGKVLRWNADKGFGFIQSQDNSNVFFHIRDYQGTHPPSPGMTVAYEEIHVGGKGPRAMAVRPLHSSTPASAAASAPPRTKAGPQAGRRTNHNHSPARREAPSPRQGEAARARNHHPAPAGAALAYALMLVWLVFLVWGVLAHSLPGWIWAAALGLNLLSFAAYALDKSAAQRGAWRISEKHLHLLSLAGGWPAAWWAQQWLRHKSSKHAFRVTYWATVLLNCAGLGLAVLRPDLIHFA
ncbi:cold shock and DUF1294 domain-containing protein [Comamonas composti]|uniref:cold shock and DUF1294 domain-containing protein n=1 Tax=Comamonas composti TaxID=408558 RepID=UPI000406CCA7|nr:cold shock and DUF1294 domain-containing protein [Comamonas composti]